MTDRDLSIQEVAAQTELSVHTLRYYEKIGLMEPIARAANGHRAYRTGDLEWINLLVRLRSTGMPIVDMQRFADWMRIGDEGIPQRREMLEEHEEQVLKQAAALQDTLLILKNKIAYYRSIEVSQKSLEQSNR